MGKGVLALFLGLILSVLAQEDWKKTAEPRRQDEFDKAQKILKTVRSDRDEKQKCVRDIIRYAKTVNDDEKKCSAIYVLGILLDDNAIPFLVQNLELRNPAWNKFLTEPPFAGLYPARSALKKFGLQALLPLSKEYKSAKSHASVIYMMIR